MTTAIVRREELTAGTWGGRVDGGRDVERERLVATGREGTRNEKQSKQYFVIEFK